MTSTRLYSIQHLTTYQYDKAVNLAYNEVRLSPRTFANRLVQQTCLDSAIQIAPPPQDESSRQDYFGNEVRYYNTTSPHSQMSFRSNSLVKREAQVSQHEVRAFLGDALGQMTWQQVIDANAVGEQLLYRLHSKLTPFMATLKSYARPSWEPHSLVSEGLVDLMSRIYHDFTFKPGATTVSTPLAEVVETMTGVCQDYSHFMLACLRATGVACRYVSGYLETLPPPGQEKLQGADASHAWVAVYLPDFGWLDLDPTNNLIPLDQHVTVAWGRDYADVAPLKGVVYGNGSQQLRVEVDMVRQEQAPDAVMPPPA
jgi:transglutaminase-like putative cysteine protease